MQHPLKAQSRQALELLLASLPSEMCHVEEGQPAGISGEGNSLAGLGCVCGAEGEPRMP